MKRYAIIVSGLPASGKTTIGRQLANSLKCDFLDKDDFLEALFHEQEIGDSPWRRMLSDKSNTSFELASKASDKVVLVSHWRPLGQNGPSGTSTGWLKDAFHTVVEVFCDCPVAIAANRFLSRVRHGGHLDSERSTDEVLNWMKAYAQNLPIGVGSLVEVNTAESVDISKVTDQLQKIILLK